MSIKKLGYLEYCYDFINVISSDYNKLCQDLIICNCSAKLHKNSSNIGSENFLGYSWYNIFRWLSKLNIVIFLSLLLLFNFERHKARSIH